MTTNQSAVLVTGAAGYIGSHVVHSLIEGGHAVVGVDDLSTGLRWQVPAEIRFYEGSIENDSFLSTIIKMHRIKTVVHCAGAGASPVAAGDPLNLYGNNVGASLSLIDTAVRCGIRRFILPTNASPADSAEASPPAAANLPGQDTPFGRSLLYIEQILADAAEYHGFDFCVVRYANVAGADANGRCGRTGGSASDPVTRVIERLFGRNDAIARELLPGRPKKCDPFEVVHVADLAGCVMAVLNWSIANPGRIGTFRCSYDHLYSADDILGTVERVSQVRIDPRVFGIWAAPTRVRHLEDIPADAAGQWWNPQHDDLEVMVRDEIRWHMTGRRQA